MTAAVSFPSRQPNLPKARARMSGKNKVNLEQSSTVPKSLKNMESTTENSKTNLEENGIHPETVTEAESDVDELIDSDTEKADAASKVSKPARGKGKNSGGASGGGKKTASSSVAVDVNQDTEGIRATPKSSSEVDGSKGKSNSSRKDQSKSQVLKNSKSEATGGNHSPGSGETPPKIVPAKRSSPPFSNHDVSSSSSEFNKQTNTSSTSREMSGRTATGGPVPYYYSTPNAAAQNNNRTNISPGSSTLKKPLPSVVPVNKYNVTSTKSEPASSEGEDLTPLEVDKFLDLIEKHNLDTRNEDDMARSVTELYQEWLEWCAKRNVQSTKSKQALVSEFVRIHHGRYGTARQQRAMGIVQGSRSIENPGTTHPMFGAGFDFVDGQGSNKQNQIADSVRDGEIYRQRGVKAQDGAMNANRAQPSSNLSTSRRSHTPVPPTGFEEGYARNGIPPAVLESMHRQIRDEIWQEVSVSLRQSIHEATAELKAENMELINRVQQLETHSDNLAQWIQHLNTVQEEVIQTIRSEPGPPPLPQSQMGVAHPGHTLRGGPREEEMVREELRPHPPPPVQGEYRSYPDSGIAPRNGAVEPHLRPYNGPPVYGAGGPANSPAKRMYPLARRTPTPPGMPNKTNVRPKQRISQHEMYDRPPVGPHPNHPEAMNHPGIGPGPRQHQPHPHAPRGSGHGGPPPPYYDEHMRGGGSGASGPPPPPHLMQGEGMQGGSGGGGYPVDGRMSGPNVGPRSYYPGPPMDDRVYHSPHPNSPSMMTDMRMNKRVRNGY